MLEPYDGKLSRTVLRGEEGRKPLALPGRRAGRVANGELSVKNALTILFFIYDENAPRAHSRVANKVVRAPALHLQ